MDTLKDIFEDSLDYSQNGSKERLTDLKEQINKEIKGIKWVKITPDLVKNLGELLNIKIPDIFISSWEKGKAIQDALSESEQSPEKTIEIELADHTIESVHKPCIEIRIKGIPQPKKINFTVKVSFELKGFILKIRNGSICEIQSGSCEITGTFKCENILIAEKKSEKIKLPGSIVINKT